MLGRGRGPRPSRCACYDHREEGGNEDDDPARWLPANFPTVGDHRYNNGHHVGGGSQLGPHGSARTAQEVKAKGRGGSGTFRCTTIEEDRLASPIVTRIHSGERCCISLSK